MKSIPTPRVVDSDPRSVEILRIWIEGKEPHARVKTALFRDPGEWGILLVDLARHVAQKYDAERTHQQLLLEIRERFDATLKHFRKPVLNVHAFDVPELVSPSVLEGVEDTYELVRVWKHADRQTFALHAGYWENPEDWGELLAALTAGIASTYAREDSAGERILALFDAEWSTPTSDVPQTD